MSSWFAAEESGKENYTEDDFLSYLAFEMFRRGQYDKVTLTYLAEYYCGAIGDMKRLWKVLKQIWGSVL